VSVIELTAVKTRRRRGFGPELPTEWQENSRCRGPQSELFFPPSGAESPEDKLDREHRAKSYCRSCSVCGDCLTYALTRREDFGVWGGLTESERRVARLKSG